MPICGVQSQISVSGHSRRCAPHDKFTRSPRSSPFSSTSPPSCSSQRSRGCPHIWRRRQGCMWTMVLRYLCGCFSEYTHFDSQALSARLTHNVLRSSRDLSAQTSATRCEPADLLGQAPVGEERSTQKSEKVLACVAGFGSSVVAWRPILMANRKGPMAMPREVWSSSQDTHAELTASCRHRIRILWIAAPDIQICGPRAPEIGVRRRLRP